MEAAAVTDKLTQSLCAHEALGSLKILTFNQKVNFPKLCKQKGIQEFTSFLSLKQHHT